MKTTINMTEIFNEMLSKTSAQHALDNMFAKSIESSGSLLEKKQDGCPTSVGVQSNYVSKWALATPDDIREILKIAGFTEGTNESYAGIVAYFSKDCALFKDTIIQSMIGDASYEIAVKCDEEIKNCVWSDENLNKYRFDQMAIGRRNQEKTIDYPKKNKAFDVTENPMKYAVALSLRPISIVLKDETVVVTKASNYDDDKYTIDDPINQVRNVLADEFKTLVESEIIPYVNKFDLPAKMREEMEMLAKNPACGVLTEIKAYYRDIVAVYLNAIEAASNEEFDPDDDTPSVSVEKENRKDAIARIENMIRIFTQGMSPEMRGKMIKFISGRTKNNAPREDGRDNRMYLSLCKAEFLLWLFSENYNELDFCGYKLLGKKTYKPGQFVYFENGQAEHAIIEQPFTGWTEIKEHNGSLYASVDAQDLIKVPAMNNKIIIKVKQGFVNKFGADKVVTALSRASYATIHAEKDNYNLELTCSDKDRNIPYDMAPCRVCTDMQRALNGFSGTVTRVFKGLVNMGSRDNGELAMKEVVYVCIDLDEVPVLDGNYDEIEMVEIEVTDSLF